MSSGELARTLAGAGIGWASQGGAGELTPVPCVCVEIAGVLSSSETSEAQIWGFELAHPNIYSIGGTAGVREGAGYTAPELWGLHDVGQRQVRPEEFQD